LRRGPLASGSGIILHGFLPIFYEFGAVKTTSGTGDGEAKPDIFYVPDYHGLTGLARE
jgi:hypothetical protein